MTESVYKTRLDGRNQITPPAGIVRAAGIEAGSTVLVEFDPSEPDVLRLRRVRASYAGALKGLYRPVATDLDGERQDRDRTTRD